MTNDFFVINNLIPDHYKCVEKDHGIHCFSKIGFVKEKDFDIFFERIKKHLGDRFQEVYCNTCTYHIDFTIYFKKESLVKIRKRKLNEKMD
jgi:hypothetical protein